MGYEGTNAPTVLLPWNAGPAGNLTGLPVLPPGWVCSRGVDSKEQIQKQQMGHGYKRTSEEWPQNLDICPNVIPSSGRVLLGKEDAVPGLHLLLWMPLSFYISFLMLQNKLPQALRPESNTHVLAHRFAGQQSLWAWLGIRRHSGKNWVPSSFRLLEKLVHCCLPGAAAFLPHHQALPLPRSEAVFSYSYVGNLSDFCCQPEKHFCF